MWQSPSGAWKMRVYDEDGTKSVVLGLGTDHDTAADMERMVLSFRAQKRWPWVELLMQKKAKVGKVYAKYIHLTHAQYLDDLVAEVVDIDLDPVVQEWADEGADPKYVRQVRRMIPAGERFPLSQFRRGFISKWLKNLKPEARVRKLSTETRSRYRAALSAFGEFLIEREHIEDNPVHRISLKAKSAEGRSEKGAKGREARHLQPQQVTELVVNLEEPYLAIEALMAATGMEKQAVLRTQYGDVNYEQRMVFARGSKRGARTRWVEATEDWAWQIFAEYARARVNEHSASDRIWPHIDDHAWLQAHHDAAKALGFPFTTPHNHRHSFAVMWIKRGAIGGLRADGRDAQWLKNQLGHEPNSTQLFTTYGVYITEAKLASKVTPTVTPTSKQDEAR